jgi:enterobactin synthetase component F
VIEHHLATLRSSRTGRITCSAIPRRHAGAGIAARLRERGEAVAFLGLLDTWPPETQNWAEKEANGLDPECWRKSSASARRLSPPSRDRLRRAV